MRTTEQDHGGGSAAPPFTGTTTARVELGRYILDVDSPGGMRVTVAPRRRQAEPPEELVKELATGPEEAGRPRDLVDRASDLIDTASAVTDKVERVVELGRGLIEGRGPGGQLIAAELDDLLELLKRLDRSGRCAEAIRLGRPLCRLFVLTLRWAALVEALRLVLHAATALADSRTQAWALHGLGTMHQGVDDVDRARRLLGEARDIRRRIDDEQGLEATEHNLKVLSKRRGALPSMATLIVIGVVVAVLLVLGLAGTVGGGSSTPSLTRAAALTPATLGFGSQEVKRTTSAQSVMWSNRGSAALAVASVKLGGADPGDFAISADGCTGKTIPSRGSCPVSVTFTPTALGARTAVLTFTSTATPSSQPVTLSGSGTNAPLVAVRPGVLDFGSSAPGQTSSPKTVTLSNGGHTSLTVGSVNLGGADAGEFAIPADGCGGTSVPPGGSCTVSVTFTPTAPGPRTATVVLAEHGNPGGHQVVTLSGSATEGPSAALSPATLDLGSIPAGEAGSAQSVTLSNSGKAPLSVTSVSLGGADPGDFAVSADGCSGHSVPPGSSCMVAVTFMPTTTGSRTATLDFNDNDSMGTQSASLSGTGLVFVPR